MPACIAYVSGGLLKCKCNMVRYLDGFDRIRCQNCFNSVLWPLIKILSTIFALQLFILPSIDPSTSPKSIKMGLKLSFYQVTCNREHISQNFNTSSFHFFLQFSAPQESILSKTVTIMFLLKTKPTTIWIFYEKMPTPL